MHAPSSALIVPPHACSRRQKGARIPLGQLLDVIVPHSSCQPSRKYPTLPRRHQIWYGRCRCMAAVHAKCKSLALLVVPLPELSLGLAFLLLALLQFLHVLTIAFVQHVHCFRRCEEVIEIQVLGTDTFLEYVQNCSFAVQFQAAPHQDGQHIKRAVGNHPLGLVDAKFLQQLLQQ